MLTPERIEEICTAIQAQFAAGSVDDAADYDLMIARAVEAAATADARALVELAVEELDDGMPHAVDCMAHYGRQYKCKCQKASTLAKLRAFLGEVKGDGHHGM